MDKKLVGWYILVSLALISIPMVLLGNTPMMVIGFMLLLASAASMLVLAILMVVS